MNADADADRSLADGMLMLILMMTACDKAIMLMLIADCWTEVECS
jgi:hypothetical protein